MTDDPATLARRCFQAYVEGDREATHALIAETFAFTSPLDNRLDRAADFARCWPSHETIAGFRFLRVVEEGSSVIVTYEGEAKGGRRSRNTEVLTIRDGRIAEVEAHFGWSLPHEAPPGGLVTP